MRIFAFQGTRYSEHNGQPGRFAAPPYDQIDDQLRDRLQGDPLSFAHLLRPVPSAGSDPFSHAAALQTRWLESDVLLRDGAPSLYPYEIVLEGGGRRLGLATLIGIEEPSSGVIRPHEQTVSKTVAERLDLLRAMKTDIGPVLLLSEDGGALEPLLESDVDRLPVLAEHRDDFGNLHRLFRTADAKAVAAYQEALAPCAGLIADGHHRYRTASLYARETGAADGSAAATKLAVVTSLNSPGLAIDPIHRALREPLGIDSPTAAVVDRRPSGATSGRSLAAEVAEARQPAVGVRLAGQPAEIWELDPETGPTTLPRAASDLAVVLLHHSLLPVWGLPLEAAVDGTVLYRSDPEVLWQAIDSGELETGFFLPPMTPAGFSAAIANGDILPPKSTRFLPKLVSGLVWASHEAEIG